MRKLELKDLWPLPVYEGVRHQFRREVIAAKQARRITVGPFMTFVFENRLTVKFQVQEVLRVERIDSPEGIEEELLGFNGMLPGPGELSATLLIELTAPIVGPQQPRMLQRAGLRGLEALRYVLVHTGMGALTSAVIRVPIRQRLGPVVGAEDAFRLCCFSESVYFDLGLVVLH